MSSACRNADRADHTGLVVAGNQASEFEVAGAVEGPDQVAASAGADMRHVGFVMRHFGEFDHQGRMRVEFLARANDHLVQQFPFVLNHEAHCLALLKAEFAGGKTHVVVHRHGDSARGCFCIAADAPGFLFFDGGVCAVPWRGHFLVSHAESGEAAQNDASEDRVQSIFNNSHVEIES